MQSAVSMVVPCYNKVKYIEAFFESVYAQKWDSIELILVNDGSTDGTREIISQWEQKFRERGYEVIIVDQENQGVAAAVKTGMLRASGEFFCTVDCDDELDPEYVSKMAGFLEENPEYKWVACNYVRYTDTESGRAYMDVLLKRPLVNPGKFNQQYYLGLYGYYSCAWIYMVRMNYIIKCKVIEHFYTRKGVTQEPQCTVPLAVGGGRLKELPYTLYRYNDPSSRSAAQHIDSKLDFQGKYLNTCMETIAAQRCDIERKNIMRFFAKKFYYHIMLSFYEKYAKENSGRLPLTQEYCEFLNKSFFPNPRLSEEDLRIGSREILIVAVENCVLGIKAHNYEKSGKLVACGVLGTVGKRVTAKLSGTPLEPDVLWDASAKLGVELCGRGVGTPDYDSLSPDDTVLIIPRIAGVIDEIKAECGKRGVSSFIGYYEMLDILSAHYYPQFYGKCKFVPEAMEENPQGE